MNQVIAAGEQTAQWQLAGLVTALLALAVLVTGWVLYAHALRVDRLHRQVLGSRATLEAQLVHRAQAAAEIASLGLLDPASALLVSRAAHEALEAGGPLVDDGLDPEAETAAQVRSRAAAESDLSRVLRTVLSEPVRQELGQTEAGREALDRLGPTAHPFGLTTHTPGHPPAPTVWSSPAVSTTPTWPRPVSCALAPWCAWPTWPGTPPCRRPWTWTTTSRPCQQPTSLRTPTRPGRPREP